MLLYEIKIPLHPAIDFMLFFYSIAKDIIKTMRVETTNGTFPALLR